ncbi:TonB-dependent receptor plug domain-containing protein [Blastomonas marina]|uniref:TonB-dependent receptor plug domain-containing protein n=1 Tax=Blastomonas marina TaxID=1867408 RepID=UPI002AC9B2D2|nr:TonB-dependent receptor plug domain-containing protein [Blastomonas marina]WPZ04391.1 TonB-dependent receptor plug domain-containing protein [Blastomonas marina]
MKTLTSTLALAVACAAFPAHAQETSDAPPPEPTEAPASAADDTTAQVYTPADFTRYAPSNALDMLNRVPGFSIRGSDQQRGLGQATGNVLFNGARPSSKSDDIFAQLSRIPAGNVARIEIVDGATLEIPGLSGQVANVVFRADELKGQFRWSPQFRTNFTDPFLTRGSVSVSGRTGELAYEFGLNNNNSGRGGAGGETLILDAGGNVTEVRDDVVLSYYDSPQVSANLTWDPAGDTIAHLNGSYQRVYQRFHEDGFRTGGGLPDRDRFVRDRSDSWNFEIGGDVEFGLGPGRLKLIGLRRFNDQPSQTTITTDFLDATPSDGIRFTRDGQSGETIARSEYSFPLFGGDAQIATEAAFNTLDNVSGLFTLDPASGEFVEVPFPGGTGGVSEDRYEAMASFGRSLTDKLSFQLTAGAENSTITTTGTTMQTREFTRPKGTFTLSWNPYEDLSISAKVSRRVGQLSFFDFLARANLNDGTGNARNNDLRPQQDWSYEGEINKQLGEWGSTQFRFIVRDVEDYVDIVPVTGGEAVGNIDSAWARAVVWNSTITFDPIGLKGVRGDVTFVWQESQLRDPFTGEARQWSGFTDTQLNIGLRHDIPGSDWAYGFSANYSHNQPRYRSDQQQRDWEGPTFADVFVEHKDVFGLRVSAYIANIFDARQYRDRTVYTGLRDASPVLFEERRDRLIGPIFGFNINGSF